MKIVAVNTIKYKGEYRLPGTEFECENKIARGLISDGAAIQSGVTSAPQNGPLNATDQAKALAEAKDLAALNALMVAGETRKAPLKAYDIRLSELNADILTDKITAAQTLDQLEGLIADEPELEKLVPVESIRTGVIETAKLKGEELQAV